MFRGGIAAEMEKLAKGRVQHLGFGCTMRNKNGC